MGRHQTTTENSYDDRRRLRNVITYRGPPGCWAGGSAYPDYQPPPQFDTGAPPSSFQLLLQDQDFSYDEVSNPVEIRDHRIADEWPVKAKPVTRKVQYDDLYRVKRVDYEYPGGSDQWQSPFAKELSEGATLTDPRRAKPSPHVSFDNRTLWQTFEYDWLGNSTKTDDDAQGFISEPDRG